MSDQYPRVESASLVGIPDVYMPSKTGEFKVVPVDAIVIERSDLPPVAAGRKVVSGPFDRSIHDSAESVRRQARHLLAIAEYLDAHPPVDEAQVEALAEDMIMAGASAPVSEGDSEAFSRAMDDIARRLVEQGWAKPEASK